MNNRVFDEKVGSQRCAAVRHLSAQPDTRPFASLRRTLHLALPRSRPISHPTSVMIRKVTQFFSSIAKAIKAAALFTVRHVSLKSVNSC